MALQPALDDIDLNNLRVSFYIVFKKKRLLTSRQPLMTSFKDPAGIFDLIEVVGNGTYGQVYKVSARIKDVFHPGNAYRIA